MSADTVLSAAALALSAACTTAWFAGWGVAHSTVTARVGLFLAALVLSGGLLHLLLRRVSRREYLARRYLDLLCEYESPSATACSTVHALPEIDGGSPWHQTLHRLRDLLEGHAARLADAEHARAALELRSRRATAEYDRLRAIVAKISEPVLAVDQYDEILLANPSAERLLGLTLADADATTPEMRVLQGLDRCDRLMALIGDARRRNSPTARIEEVEIETTSGEKHNFSVAVSCLTTAGNEPGERGRGCNGVVAVLRDISAQKQMQRNHAEFVSNASHEMKAPLAGIKAYVEMLADGDAEDEETREQFLGVISGQTERLQRLIENLLNIARIEAGVVKVNKQQQPLNELLAEALRVVAPSAEGKNITLRNDLSPLYLGVHVDRDMMLQGAINLLSNAVKYTPTGGSVTLRSRHTGCEAQFEVEDTGVGLSPADCVKIFGKFYRVEKDQHMAAGTGLGLSLAKHIVEDVHGGRLAVTSELNVGSTFSVTLPLASKGN